MCLLKHINTLQLFKNVLYGWVQVLHRFLITITLLDDYLCDFKCNVIYDFLITVKAAPHECVIRTGQS